MAHTCKLCNYESLNLYNYRKHCNTNKHINKEKITTYCYICDKEYTTRKNYIDHKNYKHKESNKSNKSIKSNKSNNSTKIIDKLHSSGNISTSNKSESNLLHSSGNISASNNISNNDDIISPKLDNIYFEKIKNIVDESNKQNNKEVVEVVNKAITKASALIKYLSLNYKSTPPLTKIKQKECIKFLRIDYNCPPEKNNYDLEKNFVQDFSRKLFIKNICKSILNMVNYKHPNKQAIWNTDCSRFNYVIKTAIDKWDEDKAGIKFTEYVIKPVLDYVSDLIHTYRTEYLAGELCNKKYTKTELMDRLKIMGYACDLQTELNNQTYIKPILKELSPYLRFLESELEEIEQEELEEQEEKERIEELEKLNDDLKNLIK
jgi:hypothetical protein